MLRLQTWYAPRGSALGHAPARPDSARPTGATRGAGHKANLLTLLSVGDTATTRDLAAVVEMSARYVSVLLGELELEGRIEKAGRGVWRLP